ncbi:hypothetical protein T492DRAFT_886464 [Pavlovales sp. CCMP2436]|nr:hypothetical protein T492DRAFT_886464 [Pavlovales sp. CCMP2436]
MLVHGVIAAPVLLIISCARAHPSLVSRNACGEAAHPTRPTGPHGAPEPDGALSVSLYRSDSSNVHAPHGAFAPGDMYAVLLGGGGRQCEALLTISGGAFTDNGPRADGDHSQTAVLCSGTRYSLKGEQEYHILAWRAPSADTAQFDVTAATGKHAAFLRMGSLLLAADLHLAKPDQLSEQQVAVRLSPALLAHGALAALAFFLVLPASVAVARYAAASAHSPTKLELVSEQLATDEHTLTLSVRFALNRVAIHRRGSVLAAALLCGSYLLVFVHKTAEGQAHLASTHARWGVAALVLVAYQLQGGLLRPPAAELPAVERGRWRIAHALSGAATLVVGWVAAALALVRAERGVEQVLALAAAALAVAAACCALVAEVAARVRSRRRAGSGVAGRGGRNGSWLELRMGEAPS